MESEKQTLIKLPKCGKAMNTHKECKIIIIKTFDRENLHTGQQKNLVICEIVSDAKSISWPISEVLPNISWTSFSA